MTPTQAQIDAAAKAIHALELEHGYVTREWRGIDVETEYAAMAKAALSEVDKIGKDTAAAQVGESEPQGTGFQAGEAEPNDARVREPEDAIDYMLRKSIANNNATIERCAKVAETVYAPGHITSSMIAAAIRKLKDAP